MWTVQINGAWQSASTDQVRELIERGVIGPQTVVRHDRWREPGRLGQVQAFALLFSKVSLQGDDAHSGHGGESGQHHTATPEPSWKLAAEWPSSTLESLARPAALALGGVAGLTCLIAGVYMFSASLQAEVEKAASGSTTTFLSVLRTGLGIYFCGRGLGIWAIALSAFDAKRPSV